MSLSSFVVDPEATKRLHATMREMHEALEALRANDIPKMAALIIRSSAREKAERIQSLRKDMP